MEQVFVVVTMSFKIKPNVAIMCFGSQNIFFGVSSRKGSMGCV